MTRQSAWGQLFSLFMLFLLTGMTCLIAPTIALTGFVVGAGMLLVFFVVSVWPRRQEESSQATEEETE